MRYPVFSGYFADPFVWLAGSTYYAVGTGPVEDGSNLFPLLTSPDLSHWRPAGGALQHPGPELGSDFWAPEVAFAEGRYWMYYSAGWADRGHHLRVASSDVPDGPYVDTGVALTDPFVCPFAIDASPFQDDDGSWYLFYARDFLDSTDGDCRAGTGIVVQPMASMTELSGEAATVIRARYDWQRFLNNRLMYGRRFDWHTVEGPCVRKRLGRYWCLFSTGRWENETYGMDWAVSDSVTGPWTFDGDASGARLLRTVPGELIGPGHNSVITGPDSETDFLVYHAWDAAMTARRMYMEPMVWTNRGPRLRQ
ncbi:MAG: glycoside hydrolase family 43 protein [Bryobacteraceae bacterium]|nr:glycoside hydrolase family 43 protein [Bryobacteraceae bacterium]